jgi:hypothetical protein
MNKTITVGDLTFETIRPVSLSVFTHDTGECITDGKHIYRIFKYDPCYLDDGQYQIGAYWAWKLRKDGNKYSDTKTYLKADKVKDWMICSEVITKDIDRYQHYSPFMF